MGEGGSRRKGVGVGWEGSSALERELAKGSQHLCELPVRATERAFAGKAGLLSLHQEPWQLLWVTSWPQPPSLLRNQGRQSRSGVPQEAVEPPGQLSESASQLIV